MNQSDYVNYLIEIYNYKKLPDKLSEYYRSLYLNLLDDNFKITGSNTDKLFSTNGVLLSTGYKRIVIGDYGAYIEFDRLQASVSNFIIDKSQKYRLSDRFINNIKYLWMTTQYNDVKIYYQLRGVTYADYKPNMYYVSPDEVRINIE